MIVDARKDRKKSRRWQIFENYFWKGLATQLALLVFAFLSLLVQKGLDLVSVQWGDLIRAILARL